MSTVTDGDWLYSKKKLCAIDFNIPDKLHGNDIREISFIDVSDLTNPEEEEDPENCQRGYSEIRSKLPSDGLEADEIVLTDLSGSPSRETGKGAAFLFSSTKDRVYDKSSIFCDLEKYKLGFKHALKLVGHRYKWEINTCLPNKESTEAGTTVNVYSSYTDWLANEIFNYVLNGMKLHFESENFGIKEDYCLSTDQKEAFYRGFAASVDEVALYATGLSSIVLYTASQEATMRGENECPHGVTRGNAPTTSNVQPNIKAEVYSYASNIAHQAIDNGTKEASVKLLAAKHPPGLYDQDQQRELMSEGVASEVFDVNVEPPPTPEEQVELMYGSSANEVRPEVLAVEHLDQHRGQSAQGFSSMTRQAMPVQSLNASRRASARRVSTSPPVRPLSRNSLVNQINADLMNRDRAVLDENENAISRKSSGNIGGQCCSESVYLLVKYLFLEFRPSSACCLWPTDKVSGFAMTESDFAALLRWGIMRYASEIASRLIDSILRQLYTTLQGNNGSDHGTMCLVNSPVGAARQRRELLKLYIKLYSERLSLQIIKEIIAPCHENRRVNDFMFLPTPCVSRPSTARLVREEVPTYLINKCSETFAPPKLESICPPKDGICPVRKFSDTCAPARIEGTCPISIEEYCRQKAEETCPRPSIDIEDTCPVRKFSDTCAPARIEGPCPVSIEEYCRQKAEEPCPPPSIDIEDTCITPKIEEICPPKPVDLPPKIEEISPPKPVDLPPKIEESCPIKYVGLPPKIEDACITEMIQDMFPPPATCDTCAIVEDEPKALSSTCASPIIVEETPLPSPVCERSVTPSVRGDTASPPPVEEICITPVAEISTTPVAEEISTTPVPEEISSTPRTEGSACSAPIIEEEEPPPPSPVCPISVVHSAHIEAVRPPTPIVVQEEECKVPPPPVECDQSKSLFQAAIIPTLTKELPPDIPCKDGMHDFNENLINNMLMQEQCEQVAVCTCPAERQHTSKQAVFSLDHLKNELDPAIKYYCTTVSDFIKDNPGGLIEMVANQTGMAGIELFVDHLTETGVTLESISEAQALARPTSAERCRPRSATARKTWTVRITSGTQCVETSEVLVTNQSTAFDEHARQLQAILQWAAASELGVPKMHFSEMDDGLMARLPEVAYRAMQQQSTVGDLLQSVVRYHEEQIPEMLLDWLSYNL